MDPQVLKHRATRVMAAVGLLSLLLSLVLLSETLDGGDTESVALQYTLYVVNAAGVIVLLGLIGTNLVSLLRQFRDHRPGTRLTLRMVAMFSILAVVPLMVVYSFALQAINHGIDSWFDVRVEQALDDALDLSRAALDIRGGELLVATERLSARLADTPEVFAASELDLMRRQSGATELTLFGGTGNIIASSTTEIDFQIERPDDSALRQVQEGAPFVSLDPLPEGGLHFRILVPITERSELVQPRTLQALYPVRSRMNELAESVQDAYSRYGELLVRREPLKLSFSLTLSLVLLLSLLAAVWGALYASRRLVAPIQDLAAGTDAVAKGDLDTRLPLPASSDEVGFLVVSFNEMTDRLAEAREATHESQKVVESERSYLGAILGRLSSGVIALDADHKVRTANAAANEILGMDVSSKVGLPPLSLDPESPAMEAFVGVCRSHFEAGEHEWREEIAVSDARGRRVLLTSCTALPGDSASPAGFILVLDDLTNLVQAQRDAAWGEVARRLAHEIKNPLTPIQLSTERIQRRLAGKLDDSDADMLDRSASTIVQQVEAMKSMVNAFGDYARTPTLNFEPVDLNRLVSEVGELYRSAELGIELELDLDAAMPEVEVDAGRMRQLLHNLVRNGLEAVQEGRGTVVRITTRYLEDSMRSMAALTVEDDGPGFEADQIGQVFDPYVTSKPKGTGLGLAIVKKMVEEHAGSIEAMNGEQGGARVSVRLPVDERTRSAMMLMGMSRSHSEDQERRR
jgi:two-component system, NtrC family, nitrogen regulation sensor histidine kinase NtrY